MTVNSDFLFGDVKASVHPHRGRIKGTNERNKRLCVSASVKGYPVTYWGTVYLKNVDFIVHRSGFERMVRDHGVRNVHAWAKGVVWGYSVRQELVPEDYRLAVYDFHNGRFIDLGTGATLTHAAFVIQSGRNCYYK